MFGNTRMIWAWVLMIGVLLVAPACNTLEELGISTQGEALPEGQMIAAQVTATFTPAATPTDVAEPTATLIAEPTITTTVEPTATVTIEPTPTSTPVGQGEIVLEDRIKAVYRFAGPAVVNITNLRFADMTAAQGTPQGTGSGFVYDTQGHIVTNYHVVAGADELLVTLPTGAEYPAELIGSDPSNDLAVIRIDAGADLPTPIPVADSDELEVGDFVVAIGNPFGLAQSLTHGLISALGRVIESPNRRFIGEAIQTSAPINPGNSGGPLLNLQGQLVGVNSQIISPSQAFAGIGFAVSSNTMQRVVPSLIENGVYPHPWLGINIWPVTPQRAEAMRELGIEMPVDEGLMILSIVPGSPADEAGLQAATIQTVGDAQIPVDGDIITAINDESITNFQELNVYLETQTQVGETIQVTLYRDGMEETVPVTLAERPEQQF